MSGIDLSPTSIVDSILTSLQIFKGDGLNFKTISSVLGLNKKDNFGGKGREDSVEQEINDMLGIYCVRV